MAKQQDRTSKPRKRVAIFHPEFREDLVWFVKNDRKVAVRILELVEAVMTEPFQGIGKPEPLRFEHSGCWSRRITREDRLVYRVTADRIDFLQARYHYAVARIRLRCPFFTSRPPPCHTRDVDTQTIVILDFGSQYTQLIARRIREQNVFSVVLPCTAPLGEIQAYKPIGIILSGGPSSVYDADAPAADPALLELGRADARHLLRPALHRASPGRQGALRRPSASTATPK